ncbi:hypothetical protein [Paraflavitalea speifideaquila]|uniref:hypothetical protein n=1 Tax=Paraflavitalea speifideaquila TaxID=3076558 RepID=UPI0028E6BB1B|nr:hypothetical protein [Paraflavitalea speifideiaquila]
MFSPTRSHIVPYASLVIAASIVLGGCRSAGNGASAAPDTLPSLDSLHFTASPAVEWDALFTRKSGWFGGDGIFAVTRDGKETPGAAKKSETLIWFSDTMLGEIEKDSLKPGYTMINNSVAVLQDGIPDTAHVRFYWKKRKWQACFAVCSCHTCYTERGLLLAGRWFCEPGTKQ